MSDDLLIKISADAKDVKTAFDNVKAQTEDLESSLAGIAKISGVAFAALTAQVAVSVKAFADSETASLELSNALQNQGIYTDSLKESYKAYAEEVSATTGISTTQLTQAQSIAQTYLGQIPITKELTQAIADYSIKAGGTAASADEIAKAIGNGTGALLRQGLQFAATDTEADRYQKTLDFINVKYAGAATAISPVTLATKQLGKAFEDNEIQLGQRFAPAITTAIEAITKFVAPSKDANSSLVDLKASAITAAFAITGLGLGIPAVVTAFTYLKAAWIAVNTQIGITETLLGAGIFVALTVAATELVLHFGQVKAVVQSFIADLGQLANVAAGVGAVLSGAFHFDGEKIKQGLKEIGEAFKKVGADAQVAWNDATQSEKKATEEQLQNKKDAAAKDAALKAQHEAYLKAQAREQNDALKIEAENGSAELLDIKKKEIETLKELDSKKGTNEEQALRDRYARLKSEEAIQRQEDMDKSREFEEEDKAARKKYGNDKVQIQTESDRKQIAEIKKNSDTEQTAQKKVYIEELKEQQKSHNQFLQDQIKYGTAYAAINQAMHSAIFQGSKQAFGDLAELQQSSNSTLKQIGRVAAVANIVIKTAESAMNIYAGFSTIPIIGPALGIAGAAAAIAFGAEQVGKVTAAQTGALVGGAGYGDTQPFFLEPGELVAPKKSFDEVVTGVAQQRGYKTDEEGGGSQNVNVMIGFDGRDAQQVLTARKIEDQAIGTYRGRS